MQNNGFHCGIYKCMYIIALSLVIKAIALPKVPSMLLGGFFHLREENT